MICKLAKTWKYPCIGGKISVWLLASPPDKRKRDLDNLAKVTLDSLQKAGLFYDDSQIDLLCIERTDPMKGGKITVSIRER